MNKRIIIAVLLFTVLAMGAFAFGIGAAVGIDPLGGLPGTNVMMSAKFDSIPFLMGLGFTVGEEVFRFGFTADYWMLNQNLVSFINVYVGPGLYLGYSDQVLIGGRLPIGLNCFPFKWWELFLEIAPTLSAGIGDAITFPIFSLQGSFGMRFWFR